MSTVKTTNIQHPSSAVENFKLAADGTVEVYDGSAWVSVSSTGVLQVVEGTQATPVTITATSYTTTNLSATITPSSASNKVLVLVRTNLFQKRDADSRVQGEVLRGATQVFEQTHRLDGATSTNNQIMSVEWVASFLDSPATTSATTYSLNGKLEYGSNNHSSTWHETSPGSIILMEVTP